MNVLNGTRVIEDLKDEVFEKIRQYGNGETVSFNTMYENKQIEVFVKYEPIITNKRKGYERNGVGRWESEDVLYRCRVEVLDEDNPIAHFDCEFEDTYYEDEAGI